MAAPLRLRLAKAILGRRAKEFIPPLPLFDGDGFAGSARLNDYTSKPSQISANVGWSFAANTSIVDPCAAVALKLYRKKKDGDREEIKEHEILQLLDNPNAMHTGEQLRQLHFTYMNFVGESYIYMLRGADHFEPAKGKLPDALQIMPAQSTQLVLGDTYGSSTVRSGKNEYPISAFIRDLNPDPANPYFGRSIIAAAAAAIDTDAQMTRWNRGIFANEARPSLIFTTNEPLSSESYERWKQQFNDEHTGADNAYKPLLIEGGEAKPYMLNQQDLDFLESRKFSRDEILAMWRVSPGMLGAVENVNRANLEAGFYIHALINVVPRVRQFVNQLNTTLVRVYDPMLELDYENPVPEDVAAKLEAAEAGVDKWWTKDEVRDMYGEKPLPDGLGSHIVVLGKGATSLENVLAADPTTPDTDPEDPEDPDNDDDDDLTEAPYGKDKALHGVKKKP
jgi:HK97 family phage portal protein